MKTSVLALTACWLIALPGLASAQGLDSVNQSSIYNNTVPTTWPGPEAARISGILGKPNQDLFGVRFVEINGVSIQPRGDIWLEPGSYTIKVLFDAAHSRRFVQRRFGIQRRFQGRPGEPGYNQIELELEANRTYEIRGRYDPDAEGSRYSVIVHQVLER
jgi:hypothetical protein